MPQSLPPSELTADWLRRIHRRQQTADFVQDAQTLQAHGCARNPQSRPT